MKKAIVLLLVLAMASTAFAQVTTKVELKGGVTLINQDLDGSLWLDSDENGLWFTASNDTAGLTLYDANVLTGPFELAKWNVWYKFMDGGLKLTIGNTSDTTLLMNTPNWLVSFSYFGYLGGEHMTLAYTGVENLTLGALVYYNQTAEPTADLFQEMDFGAKYAITDIGTVGLMVDLGLVSNANAVALGFDLSAVENLTADVLYQLGFGAATTHDFAVGVSYSLMEGAAYIGAEFAGAYDTAFTWDAAVTTYWDITEALYFGADFTYASTNAYNVSGYVGYTLASVLAPEVSFGYDGADFTWAIDLIYNLNF
ncbi:MAG: hypothetical protein KBB32_07930 [Spirochaetia bacterium]|nr:hypothetical protein [Spirochaetia bacterium]